MSKGITRFHTTSVGTTVELTYVIEDERHVRITGYRRRVRGGTNFRRVKEEEGQVVSIDQLPFDVTEEA